MQPPGVDVVHHALRHDAQRPCRFVARKEVFKSLCRVHTGIIITGLDESNRSANNFGMIPRIHPPEVETFPTVVVERERCRFRSAVPDSGFQTAVVWGLVVNCLLSAACLVLAGINEVRYREAERKVEKFQEQVQRMFSAERIAAPTSPTRSDANGVPYTRNRRPRE